MLGQKLLREEKRAKRGGSGTQNPEFNWQNLTGALSSSAYPHGDLSPLPRLQYRDAVAFATREVFRRPNWVRVQGRQTGIARSRAYCA
ncbi:hypothetical protein SRHO_G00169350 [Serrasalmus rhombeus]